MHKLMARVSQRLSQVVRLFSNLGLIAITAIIAWQVFARYVLNASPSWAEQAALLLLIWYVLLAAAAGVREGFHIRIPVVVENLPLRYRLAVALVAHALVGLFGIAMTWWGIELANATWAHVIPALGISRGFAYLPIPIAGVLIAGWSLEHIIARCRRQEIESQWS